MTHRKVLHFIERFASAKDCFLYGCCYWFARILFERFIEEATCELMYHVVDNHFATLIDGELYDASGNISSVGFIPWDKMQEYDSLLYDRIIKDTVYMEDSYE